jgi:hypothetical protein
MCEWISRPGRSLPPSSAAAGPPTPCQTLPNHPYVDAEPSRRTTNLHVDAVLREMSRELVWAALPYETQIAAAGPDPAGRDQPSNIESGTANIQLLVPEAEGDSTIGVIDNLRSNTSW